MKKPTKSKSKQYQYSGPASRKFWNKINKLKDPDRHRLYRLGVMLQNLEEYVCEELEKAK